jgi:hypothetical protein
LVTKQQRWLHPAVTTFSHSNFDVKRIPKSLKRVGENNPCIMRTLAHYLKLAALCCGVTTTICAQNTPWFTPLGQIGCGTTLPLNFQFNAKGTTAINSAGWKNAIGIYDQGALSWDGQSFTDFNYFMAYSSSSPAGDFYQGFQLGYSAAATPTYVSKVWVTNPPATIPAGSTHIYKNLLVFEGGNVRRLGVNTLNPQRSTDIVNTTDPQLRLTQTENADPNLGICTDFKTTAAGNLNITPRENLNLKNVGIHVVVPSERLDVNGNARLRSVPTTAPDYIMTGVQASFASNDIKFSKIALTGNPGDVLLGTGSFGPAPASLSNNGLSTSGSVVQLGQNCVAPGNPGRLLDNREVPLNNFNIYFTGQGAPTTNAIGLGYTACSSMPAKLNVLQQNASPVTVATTAGSFINRDQLNFSPDTMRGLKAISDGTQGGNNANLGGDFVAMNAPINIGVKGKAAGGAFGYGIYGYNSGSYLSNQWAGWFQGHLNISGTGFVSGVVITSDQRYKNNIKKLESVSEKLARLNGYTYQYRTEEFKEKNFPDGEQIGLIAQELKAVFPQLVLEDSKGFLSVNYQGMVPVLLEAIKEQQSRMNEQERQIGELKTMMQNIAGAAKESDRISSVSLKEIPAVVLEQNVPNPFAEQTTINYILTSGIQKAQILFYNSEGRLVNSVDLKPVSGKGQLNVFASDLSNGVYTYTLVVDGKVMASKKMIREK